MSNLNTNIKALMFGILKYKQNAERFVKQFYYVFNWVLWQKKRMNVYTEFDSRKLSFRQLFHIHEATKYL